ncbi:MAG: carbohydrate binding domain-containing protein [Verrucomicrobiota bacterium]|nr:carbohydrate binding domain-containing protein [Verrucomicrobiota bacterium]
MHAQRLIVESGKADTFAEPLKNIILASKPDEIGIAGGAIHALWALHGLGKVDAESIQSGLSHNSAGARRAAASVIPRKANYTKHLLKALNDPDHQVRKDVLLALSEMPPSEEAGNVLFSMRKDNFILNDRWLPTAFQMACARHGAGYLKAALAKSSPANATAPPKAVQIPKENLILNSGFEAIEGTMPKNWKARNYSGRADHRVVSSGRGGKGNAIMIESAQGADSSIHFDLKVKKRTTYQLSAWIKTEGLKTVRGGRGAQLNIHALPDQPRTRALKGDNDWTKVTLKFKTDDRGTISINCLYGGWGHATGKAYWDDIELIQIDAGQGPDISEDTESIVAANLVNNASSIQLSSTLNEIITKPTELGNRIKKMIKAPEVAVKESPEDEITLSKTHQIIKLKAIEGLKFDKIVLEAKSGKPIAVIVSNPDLLQHNFVIGSPGSLERIGSAADALITNPKAIEMNYVPQTNDILAASELLDPGTIAIVKIDPLKPGKYPYVCTFPGHWRIMQGYLEVK